MDLKITHAALVYQAGIANVFDISNDEKRVRLMQSDFRSCEHFARGLKKAGVDVVTLACNKAGDIAEQEWREYIWDAPFSEQFCPVGHWMQKDDDPEGN